MKRTSEQFQAAAKIVTEDLTFRVMDAHVRDVDDLDLVAAAGMNLFIMAYINTRARKPAMVDRQELREQYGRFVKALHMIVESASPEITMAMFSEISVKER